MIGGIIFVVVAMTIMICCMTCHKNGVIHTFTVEIIYPSGLKDTMMIKGDEIHTEYNDRAACKELITTHAGYSECGWYYPVADHYVKFTILKTN